MCCCGRSRFRRRSWLLLPPHLRNFVDFVENRSSGPSISSAAGLLFYPRVFVEQYHATSLIGIAVMVLAVAALARIGGAAPAVRTLLLSVGDRSRGAHAPSLQGAAIPPHRCAGAVARGRVERGHAVERALARAGRDGRASDGGRCGSTACSRRPRSLRLSWRQRPRRRCQLRSRRYTVPSAYGPLLDRIVDLAEATPTLVLGTWNQMSPALVEWRLVAAASRDNARMRHRRSSCRRLARCRRAAPPSPARRRRARADRAARSRRRDRAVG